MLDKTRAKKLISKGTYTQISKLLYEIDYLDEKASEKTKLMKMQRLRGCIQKLFTFNETFELHDSHIIELAEVVVELYPEMSSLEEYAQNILTYTDKQMKKYEQLTAEYVQKLRWKERDKDKDPDGYLDLKYLTWTYTTGYHHQTYHTYELINSMLDDLIKMKKAGIICTKKTAARM